VKDHIALSLDRENHDDRRAAPGSDSAGEGVYFRRDCRGRGIIPTAILPDRKGAAMGRPVHFEIHADDPERAAGFYRAAFGWTITRWDGPMPYWLIATGSGAGIDGGLMRREGPPPTDGAGVNSWVCVIDVAGVDAAVASIEKAGGIVVVPKMAVPGIGYLAYFKDTEGNIVGVMQDDPSAA
jgi:predicted enzyme related to lactoylglutathione lyase